jgi:hypothetical protein
MKRNLIEAIVSSGLPNVKFGDNIVGNATPSKDKINKELLNDVSIAAKNAGVEVTITTAVTGHDKGSRHEVGNAVDIAMVNGEGFSGGESEAKKKGIYEPIQKFVEELVSMGYKKNSESGNDKAVLTFGFKGHDNHIHVSRKSGGSQPNTSELDKFKQELLAPEDNKFTFTDISGSSTMKSKGVPLKDDKYFVLHHTAGRGKPKDVVNILNNRGLGIQWIIDRDGNLFKSLPSGSFGQHVVPNKPSAPKDLSNRTAQGVEIIASNDSDILPKQCKTALKLVKNLGYPLSSIYGHGELQTNKETTEGKTCKEYIIKNYNLSPDEYISTDSETKQDGESKPSVVKNFEDIFSFSPEERRAKFNDWVDQQFNLKENIGLKKRSVKINEEIERIKKLF